jgi:hypothetical protein
MALELHLRAICTQNQLSRVARAGANGLVRRLRAAGLMDDRLVDQLDSVTASTSAAAHGRLVQEARIAEALGIVEALLETWWPDPVIAPRDRPKPRELAARSAQVRARWSVEEEELRRGCTPWRFPVVNARALNF